MRLIDADEIRLPKGFFEKIDNVPKFYEWLDTLPTVDVVEVVAKNETTTEVVRCKDCFHFWDGVCKAHIDVIYVDDNDFCSMGERREDGE